MRYQYHEDVRGAAFKVKVYGVRDDRGTDEQRERAWESMRDDWWHDAKMLAIKHGFEDVACCGRSGGWLAPTPVVQPGDDDTALDAFAEDLDELFAQVNVLYTEYLTREIEEDDIDAAKWTIEPALTWRVLDGDWWQVMAEGHIVAYACNEADALRIMELLR